MSKEKLPKKEQAAQFGIIEFTKNMTSKEVIEEMKKRGFRLPTQKEAEKLWEKVKSQQPKEGSRSYLVYKDGEIKFEEHPGDWPDPAKRGF